MNTVLKGDKFENERYELITEAIQKELFGISPNSSRVFAKKKYFSDIRKKEIIFDLSIEVWPPNAERCSFLFLIECKSYSTKKVPIGDVNDFLYRVREISTSSRNDAKGVKGVFISNSSFQESVFESAKSTGLMIIEVNGDNKMEIKLHKSERLTGEKYSSKIEYEFENFIYNVFNNTEIEGLRKYSKKTIESVANRLINTVDRAALASYSPIPLLEITEYLMRHYKVKFEFESKIEQHGLRDIDAYFDIKENLIKVDSGLLGTRRFSFLLAHEIGHFILHRKLKMNQQLYEGFRDSEYDFLEDRHKLKNCRNWIEWQANEFAACLLMPRHTFIKKLISSQQRLGINKSRGHIYLDDQQVNMNDFKAIKKLLSEFFNVTEKSIEYRLRSLQLITDVRKKSALRIPLRNILKQISKDVSSKNH